MMDLRITMQRLWSPEREAPYPLSRSRIDLFVECRRCSYLSERLGVRRPFGPSFTLNNAVDTLLKREYDRYRREQTIPPLLDRENIAAVPFDHPDLPAWRDNRRGIRFVHKESGFEVFGAIDDVWITPSGELIVVDYKATSKERGPTLDSRWGEQYKRQLEVYQWLFARNHFSVHPTAYIVYVNATTSEKQFDRTLHFEEYLFPHHGDTSWIEPTLLAMRETFLSDKVPPPSEQCEFCLYRNQARSALRSLYAKETESGTNVQ
ncbi:hypothetical protein D6792_00095 [Candidatus Parcubacteria bacterium]|nr:MAG: hypothetical protein D6792_00095 [Candidatus Parcubacteria bacterium]